MVNAPTAPRLLVVATMILLGGDGVCVKKKRSWTERPVARHAITEMLGVYGAGRWAKALLCCHDLVAIDTVGRTALHTFSLVTRLLHLDQVTCRWATLRISLLRRSGRNEIIQRTVVYTNGEQFLICCPKGISTKERPISKSYHLCTTVASSEAYDGGR